MGQWASKPTSGSICHPLQHPLAQDPGLDWPELHFRLEPPGGESGQHPVGAALREDLWALRGAQNPFPNRGLFRCPIILGVKPTARGGQDLPQGHQAPAAEPGVGAGLLVFGFYSLGNFSHILGRVLSWAVAPQRPLTHPGCSWPLSLWASPDP